MEKGNRREKIYLQNSRNLQTNKYAATITLYINQVIYAACQFQGSERKKNWRRTVETVQGQSENLPQTVRSTFLLMGKTNPRQMFMACHNSQRSYNY